MPGQRSLVRRLVYLPSDILGSLTGNRPRLVPPRGKIFTGRGDFVAAGEAFLQNFIELCGLQPHHRVLDVGCGIGRVARPLSSYLSREGRYEGIDIVRSGIRWCSKHYRDHANFSFTHVSLQNDLYNPGSSSPADSFCFPCLDSDFDLVVLTSVFTHMQPAEVENYLAETARVLDRGGHCFATFFLITEKSEAFLDNSPRPFFAHRHGDYFLHDARVKNANIAYRMGFVQKMARQAGLRIKSCHEGWWSGSPREECLNFQDVMVFTR